MHFWLRPIWVAKFAIGNISSYRVEHLVELFSGIPHIFSHMPIRPYAPIREARHAPPRPALGKTGCPGPPRPRNISTLPRPANIVRMFLGKARGKCSYITKRFCGSKTFEQYFLAPKVLLEDIQIPPIHF